MPRAVHDARETRLRRRKAKAEKSLSYALWLLEHSRNRRHALALLESANDKVMRVTRELADFVEKKQGRAHNVEQQRSLSRRTRLLQLRIQELEELRRLPNLLPGAADAPGTNTETSSPVAGERELRPSRVDGSRLAGLAGG